MPIKRKLTFSSWVDEEDHPFDRVGAAAALAALDPDDQVLTHGEALTAVEVIANGTEQEPTKLRLMALRDYDNRPSAWQPGQTAGPVQIGETEYIADIAHVLFWGDNVVAHDYYGNAPGLGRLSAYFRRKADQRVIFRALYEPDTAEWLKDLAGLRGVQFSIHDPAKRAHAKDEGIFSNLIPEAFGDKVPSINVSVSMGRESDRDAVLAEDVTDEALEAADKAEQFFDSLYITGKSSTETTKTGKPKTITVNMLSQRLQVEQEIERAAEGGNLPDQEAVFEALRRARQQLQNRDDALARAIEYRLRMEQE